MRRATFLHDEPCIFIDELKMTQFLHSMIRITDPEATIAFFKLIGVHEVRRFESEQGRFTLIFLAAPGG